MRPCTLPRLKLQDAIRHAQVGIGRNDIDVVRLDRLIIRHFAHWKRSGPRQDIRQRAVARWIEMLHQHESHAGICRQMLKQLRERLQPAGRGADADNDVPSPWLIVGAFVHRLALRTARRRSCRTG